MTLTSLVKTRKTNKSVTTPTGHVAMNEVIDWKGMGVQYICLVGCKISPQGDGTTVSLVLAIQVYVYINVSLIHLLGL